MTPTRPDAAGALPPLVDPVEELSPAELERYSRHVILPDLGVTGQRRLKSARVLVVGAGGLGSPALLYLAAAGVGTIGIVDSDLVEESNLQRPVAVSRPDVGRSKVAVARERISALNPHLRVIEHELRLTAANALEVLGGYHLVLDGTDSFPTRYLISDSCELLGLPCVWGSIYRFDGQVSVFWRGHGPTYRDLFPLPPPPGTVPSCAEGGVLGALCGCVGSVMATEAVKLIAGIGEPLLGRLLTLDAARMSWREIRVRPQPARPAVTALVDYEAFCGLPPAGPPGSGTDGAEPGDGPAEADAGIGARDLAERLAERAAGRRRFTLVDVREPHEREIVAIPGAIWVPLDRFLDGTALRLLPPGPIVLHCKSGARSARALRILRDAGREDVVHLTGGVLAWVAEVDPALPRY